MLTCYHPEMKETAPTDTQIHATLSHYGKHWFIRTKLQLKGRGITFLKTDTAETLVPGSRFVGFHQYKVTEAAFEVLSAKYSVASEVLL